MEPYNDHFMTVDFDAERSILRLLWKESTFGMTADEFKTALVEYARLAEQTHAENLLVDVRQFRFAPSAEIGPWRLEHIAPMYNRAGVKKFAYIFPDADQAPPNMRQSAPGEEYDTNAFDSEEQARAWFGGAS